MIGLSMSSSVPVGRQKDEGRGGERNCRCVLWSAVGDGDQWGLVVAEGAVVDVSLILPSVAAVEGEVGVLGVEGSSWCGL